MSRRQLVRGLAAVGAVGIGTGGLVAGIATPAFAFIGTCPTTVPAATLVADNVCEVRFTSDGSFTPPPGITKLSAVLIGAGSGSLYDGVLDLQYAGNGGAVVYVDSVTLGADVSIIVGTGGTSAQSTGESITGGGATSVNSDTAGGGVASGTTSCSDTVWLMVPGNGAAGVSTGSGATCFPGPGYALSTFPLVDATLFPAAADGGEVYGRGGTSNLDSDPAVTEAFAGTGADVNTSGAAPAGSDGLVILRFAPAAPPPPPPPPRPSLAATGSESALPAAALGATALAAGILLMVLRRRRPTHD
ncbi:MAG: LPXTG cell wall anchor domain-containing protein [Pseudolysinimonas sp.]